MSRIRQFYIYGISLLSLLFLATGIENLVRLLVQTLAGTDATAWLWLNRGSLRQQVSFFAALTVINLPVWIGHWLAANRPGAQAEPSSTVRRTYLYLVMAGALLFFVPAAIGLIRIPLWALLRAPIEQPVGSAMGAPIGLALVTVPIWIYHRRLARTDSAAIGEAGALGTPRRLYDYVAGFVLLIFLLINVSRLGTSVWEGLVRLLGGSARGDWAWVSASLPAFGSATAVFLTLWWWHWTEADAIARGSGPTADAERRSFLRRLSMYGVVLMCLNVAAINASTVLNDLFRAALGSADPTHSGRNLVDALGQPIVWGVAYASFWLYGRWLLQRDAFRATEAADQATLRQLYYYLVAAVGLSLFAVGLILLLTTLLSLSGLTPEQLAADWFRDRISSAATLVILGGPIWLGHWLHQQSRLNRPDSASEERTAAWRRVFLYLVLFVAVASVLVDAASLLYQLFLVALGDTVLPSLLEAVRTPLSVIVVASALIWYHWRILRDDLAAQGAEAVPGPSVAVVVLQSASSEQLDAVLAKIAQLSDESVQAEVLHEPRLEMRVAEQLRRWRNP